jgi:hypothetical protein
MTTTRTRKSTGFLLGRCTCGTVVRRTGMATFGFAVCPTCDADVRIKQVKGSVTQVECDARCINAVGGACDCSCGGENHGAGHAA